MLNSFCCMSLRTAGIVIAWLGILGSSMFTVTLSCSLMSQTDTYNETTSGESQLSFDRRHRSEYIVQGIFLAVSLLQLLSSCLLLWGTLKKKHLMLLPWMINTSIIILIIGFYTLREFTLILAQMFYSLMIIPELIIIVLFVWFFLVIYSLYKEIQSAQYRNEIPLMPTTYIVPQIAQTQNTVCLVQSKN